MTVGGNRAEGWLLNLGSWIILKAPMRWLSWASMGRDKNT